MNKLDLNVGILPTYIISYEYNLSWATQFLICPIYGINKNSGYIPEGVPVKLIDLENDTTFIGVMCGSKLVGILPKEILNDYIDRGFLRTNANYCVANNKKSVMFTLQS